MADGNVGSLYMTLGLKDEVTVGLNKVTKSLGKSKQYTDELKKEVEGLRKELKGVSGTDMSEPIKKALSFIKKYDSEVYKSINETNKLAYALRGVLENNKGEIKINLASIPKAISELAKLSNKLDSYGDDKAGAKAFKNRVANAIDYLKMLQSIERKQRELNDLAISSRNIDKADIASAKMMLNDLKQSFAKQLFAKDNSLIDTNFMSEVKKVLSMTMTEISDYMRNLKKDNPLSVFVNSADMLTSKIASANKKILEMQSLTRGSKIPNLFDDKALNGLRGIVGEMQSLINKEGKGEKTDINKINRLVSEYAKLVSQAELAKSTFKQLSREYDNANTRLASWLGRYRELQSIRNDRIRLGLDTSAIDAEISRVRTLFSEINSIRRGLGAGDTNFLGMLGSRGTGVDTTLYNGVVKAARAGIAEQEKIDRNTDKLIAKQEKAAADEYSRKQRQTEQRLKDIDREGIALQKNAEIQQRYTEAIDKAISKKVEAQNKYQGKRDEEQLRFENAVNAALGERILLRQKEAEEQRRLLSMVAPTNEITKRFSSFMQQESQMRPSQPLFNADSARDLQIAYGKAFDNLSKQWDELVAKMKTISPNLDGNNWSGKPLSSRDLAVYNGLKSELDVIETKMQGLVTLSERLASRTSAMQSATYKPYSVNSQEETQRRMQESNTLKNAIIERMQTQEAASKKKKQDDKDAAAAEKQRQREVEITIRRTESLYRALTRLRSAKFTSDSFGFDTRTAAVQISYLEAEMRRLYDILGKLQTADFKDALGKIGNTGNGRVVTEANYVASQYEKANGQAEKNIVTQDKLAQKIREAGRQAQEHLVKGFKDAHNAASGLSSTVQDLKSLFLQGGLVFGAQQFAMSIIRTGGEMEKQHIAMQSILGDMQNANTMFNQTKELALQSPFTFSELNRDVKQLAAYGVEYENLYDTTKRLADMASGLGVSFERIALAFGQVQARGWLDGKELRQIAYAGIPLLDRLSKYYSQREGKKVSTSDVKGRITNREVSFQDVKNIFWEMTDAGGQFYNMQLTLSETLLGRYNKLKDAWEIMLADFARGDSVIGGTFKWVLDLVTSLVQQMHTLGPVIAAAFSGFAIKKGIAAMGGTKGSSFLATKSNIANDLKSKVMQGQQLSAIEQRILATKSRITNEDLKALSASKALTLQDLNRLRIAGQITAEQYKQYRNIVRQQIGHKTLNMQMMRLMVTMRGLSFRNDWSSFSTSALAAFRIVGVGAKALGATLWSAIGGLPGLIITGVTMGISYLINKNAELKQSMGQTADELKDRYKQIGEFIRDNDVNKAIGSGDTKQIDNLVESYKEKLKELAPYDYDKFIMTSEEKKSHEERLKYLEEELGILQSANAIAQQKAGDSDTFSNMKNNMENAKNAAETMLKARDKMLSYGSTETDKTIYQDTEAEFNNTIKTLKEFVASQFKGLNNSPEIQSAYKQFRESMIAQLAPTEEAGNVIRAALDNSLGLSNGWLERKVLSDGFSLIEKVASELALKIRSGRELDNADKEKVRNLMEVAVNELSLTYPMFAGKLQELLNQSDFVAKIRLVYTPMGDIEKQVYNNMVPSKLKGDDLKKAVEKFNILKPYLAGQTSFYEATNKVQQKLNNLWNEKKNRQTAFDQGKMSKELLDAATKEYEDLWNAAYNGLGYKYIPEDKKSNKTPKGSQEDEELKRLRKRIELYKKFYSEYRKLQDLVGQGALDKLRKDGEFAPVFGYKLNNITDYESSVRQLLGAVPANTADRIDYKNQAIADIQTKNRELFSEQIAKDNEELSTQLGIISEQYEVYKKIVKLTGDNKGAMSIAFSGGMSTKSYSEYLKSQIAKVLPAHNLSARQNYTLDDVLGMSQSQFNSSYGKNNSRLSVLFKAYKDEQNKIKTETINMIADVIEKNRTLEQQLEDINTEYEYQLGLLQAQQDLTPNMRKRAEEGLKKTRDEKTASVQFEIFKRNSDWVTIFDDLDRVSTNTINSMIDKIDTFSKTTGLSVEVVKQLRDALDKLRKESMDRNPFDALFNATSRGNVIGNVIKNNEYVFSRGKKAYIDAATAKRTGLKEGEYSKSELENEQTSAYEDFPDALKAIENKFKALGDVLNPVLDLFDALGMEDTPLAQGMGLVTNALGAASGVAGGLNALGLSSLGPYGAAIGAGLSVVSGLFAMHDKALQKEIEASERRQKELENMTKNIESVLESTLGGVYSYKASRDTAKTLDNVIKNYETNTRLINSGDFFGRLYGYNELRYSKETYDQAVKAQKSGTAYDTELASLMAQKDELVKQRQAEENKKKTDADAIQNYDQQIKEMEQSISDFTQNFLKDIYSIDIKSWASQLTDAIVEAWAKGENAADAYHDKVQELMKDLTKNILSQKIMEIALQPALIGLENLLKQKGRLDEADIPDLTSQLIEAGNNAVGNITDLLDALKEQGVDLSENGTLSVSNSIKSITEDTADLLASYLNAIRLDVSVNRENIRMILLAVQTMPELNNIARSQLTQLTTLVTLAEARNGKLDDMYSWMNKVTNGVLKISMK